MTKWQTKDSLMHLHARLVEHPSITGSNAEIAIAEYIELQLRDLPYFRKNRKHLRLHPTSDGRKFVSALVKKGSSRKTVILISHFDVVDIEDYGEWKNLAFHPYDLTNAFYDHIEEIPQEVQEDLRKGKWLFGRGSMDMKAGLALHMSMLEQASEGKFDGNILLISVPDEEANSTGMREAAPVLLQLAKEYELEYTTCLNSEPMFTNYPGDDNDYIYTGSLGKVLPGFLCYGQETHVGEPFSGLNANYMAAEITKEVELNTDYCEMVEGEVTPPPTNLMQKDLKEGYSVQIPHVAVTNFNVLFMEKMLDKLTESLLSSAQNAAVKIEEHYLQQAKQFTKWQSFTPKKFSVNVLTYEELFDEAVQQYGEEEIKRRQDYIVTNYKELGDRDLTTRLVYDLAGLCKEMAPMIVLFYNPPFYPAISSRHNNTVIQTMKNLKKYGEENYQLNFKHQRYFPGLSDLSFVGLQQPKESLIPLICNMPLFGSQYTLPIQELKELDIPVMNVGPRGKDAHKWTERLDVHYSFEVLPDLLTYTIRELLK